MPVEVLGVELEVFVEEGGDIEHAVVVTQSHFVDMLVVGLNQLVTQVIHQHFLLVLVISAHLQEKRSLVVVSTADYQSGVIGITLLQVAEEELPSLDTPAGTLRRIGHGGEGRDRSEFPSLEGRDECSMSSHAESSDGFVVLADGEECRNDFWKFLIDVGEHLEVLLGGFASRINIIASRISNLPIFINLLNASLSGTGIREDHCDPVLLCVFGKA